MNIATNYIDELLQEGRELLMEFPGAQEIWSNVAQLQIEVLNTLMTSESPDQNIFDKALQYIIENELWWAITAIFRCSSTVGLHWCRDAFMRCREFIPEELLYNLTLEVYITDGFEFPREPVIDLMGIRPNDYLSKLPESFSETDPITVYRASTTPPESIHEVKDELSWTIDLNIAKYYYRLRAMKQSIPCYIYIGKIHKSDIIAYTSSEAQCEIIQSGHVDNIEQMDYGVLDIMCHLQNVLPNDFSMVADKHDRTGKAKCREQSERLLVAGCKSFS